VDKKGETLVGIGVLIWVAAFLAPPLVGIPPTCKTGTPIVWASILLSVIGSILIIAPIMGDRTIQKA
jgi:hypothetical protein